MKRRNIESVSIRKCCGCEACRQICPLKCITFYEDKEGFLYPRIDKTKCLYCGKCLSVCPANVVTQGYFPDKRFAFILCEKELLSQTSSGGFFTAIAAKTLADGGVVFGAKFNSNNEVVHGWIETSDRLDELRRSKYVQSKIGNAFIDVKKFLSQGRKVLFVGTPCQVKALKLFIGDNLLLTTVDFICHGVPSPKVFLNYLQEIAERFGTTVNKLKNINFRNKSNGPDYSLSISYLSESYCGKDTSDPYLRGFLRDLYLRPSCYSCSSKGFCSGSDYTMADFWGIRKLDALFSSEHIWISQVFTKNDKLMVFKQNNSEYRWKAYKITNKRQIPSQAYKSSPMTIRRKQFFCNYEKCEFSSLVESLSRKTVSENFKLHCRRYLKNILSSLGVLRWFQR